MGSWFYRWEDGTVSFVSAPTKLDAAVLLDEIGAASPDRLEPVREGFFVTYQPKKDADREQGCPWKEGGGHCEGLHSILDELHGKAPPEPTPRVRPSVSEVGAPPTIVRTQRQAPPPPGRGEVEG